MLKTSGSTESTARPEKGGVGVGGDGGDDDGPDDEHSPRYLKLAQPRLRSSMMRLMMVVESWSKSRQRVEESSKSPKNLKGRKSCKGHRFGGMFTEAPILRQRTLTFNRVLTVF